MKFETYVDSRIEWRWRLKADNGKIIADSGEGYKNYTDCLHAINFITIFKERFKVFCFVVVILLKVDIYATKICIKVGLFSI